MKYDICPILQNKLGVKILYYFSKLQYDMFCDFGDEFSTFFPEVVNFISMNSVSSFIILFTQFFSKLNKQILQFIDKKQTEKKTKDFFLIPVNQLLDKLPFISEIFDKNKIKFENFLNKANVGKVKILAHLYMIKCLSEIVKSDEQNCSFLIEYFTEQNYKQFLNTEKQIFYIPFLEQNMNDQISDRNKDDKSIYKKISFFFNQYFSEKIDFFKFKSNIEIVTCAKIFPNSPPFAYFIRNALFGYDKHKFDFKNFCDSIECHSSQDQNQNQDEHVEIIHFPSYNYTQYEKQSGESYLVPSQLIYPNEKAEFEFQSSSSLPNKIAAVRFITKYVLNHFLRIQNMEFPTLNFSCGFLKVPSSLLINFISLSILPNFNDYPSDSKLNNENFFNILKFSNSIFPAKADEILINNDVFEFITFYSVILSSKIRFGLAQDLISILKESSKDKFHEGIYLFSINELKYAQNFIKSKNIDIHSNSYKTINLFLAELFSSNYIDKYYSHEQLEDEKKRIGRITKIRKIT